MVSTFPLVSASTTGITLGLIVGSVLVPFLILKELASASKTPKLVAISKFLNVGIIPLAIIFTLSVAATVAQLIG